MARFFLFFIVFLFFISNVLAASFQFERDLYFGLQNDSDVSRLQEFLTDKGYYSGPITGNFFTLTRAAVIKFQQANAISPAAGYFGPKSRAAANQILSPVSPITDLQAMINALLAQVEDLQRQLDAAKAREAAPVVTVPPPPPVSPPPLVATSSPLASSLRINVVYPSITLGRYTNVTLNEISLNVDDPNEKIAITRIRFKNTGTLPDGNFSVVRLLESGSNREVARLNLKTRGLAFIGNIKNGIIEFIMTKDASKIDNGLMVSGKTYSINADLVTPNTTEQPTVKLDILSASDIDAWDGNDLTRRADITKNNSFPILGPTITVKRL
jgi:peptidoglycan hydrolase-like protein with peptidoglycan-binding domain